MPDANLFVPDDANPVVIAVSQEASDVSNVNSSAPVSSPRDSSPVAGPSSAVAGPSSAVAGPSSAVAGPSSAVAGPSSAVAGPSSPVAGPSSLVQPFSSSSSFSGFSSLSSATSSDSPYTASLSSFPSFQKYLRLSDSLIQTKRFKKKKNDRPDAITGSAYFQMETQKQEEKREKLRQQEERKQKRIQKQLEAQEKGSKTVGKRTRRAASSSESDDNVVFDDSDDDVEIEEDNCCAACLGNNEWNVDSAWIGCSNERCKKWFHKNCISMDVNSMTDEQLQKFEYFCQICEKRRMKR